MKNKLIGSLFAVIALVFCFLLVKPVHAEAPESFAISGASVRLADPSGIRFVVKISASDYDDLTESGTKEVNFGCLITLKSIALDNLLTAENAETYKAKNIQTPTYLENGDNYEFKSVIYDIPSAAFDYAFVARGYYEIDGEYTYTDQIERSIANVAYQALLLGEEDPDNYDDLRAFLANETITDARLNALERLGFIDATQKEAYSQESIASKAIAKDAFVETLGDITENMGLTGATATAKLANANMIQAFEATYIDEATDTLEGSLVARVLNVLGSVYENTYIATFDANGGTLATDKQFVTVGDEETLPTPTPNRTYEEFLGWYTNDGTLVEDGEWEINENVDLTAKYTKFVTFDNMDAVPSYLTSSNATLSLVEMNGGKAIAANVTDTNLPSIKVALSFFDKYFDYEDVDYVAFDLKFDSAATTGAANIFCNNTSATTWKAYEAVSGSDFCQFNTAPKDAFEYYYISRAMYQGWKDNNVENPVIVTTTSGLTVGQSFYIDNIHPVTEDEKEEEWFSFEYGALRTNVSNQILFYHPTNNAWELCFYGVSQTTGKFTNANVTDGTTALSFTKNAANALEIYLNINEGANPPGELEMRAAGYIAIDLYVPEDSDAVQFANNSQFKKLAKGWNTLYGKVPSDPAKREIGIKVYDTTGSQYIVDNIRLVSEAEYLKAMGSFESGMLRDDTKGHQYIYDSVGTYDSVYSVVITSASVSNAQFDKTIVKDGKQSLSFQMNDQKTTAVLAINTNSDLYPYLKNGFSFWIYSSTELDGVNGKQIARYLGGVANTPAGIIIPKNTWTKITVTADEFASNGQFLWLLAQGKYYLDCFEPLPVE